METPSTTTDVTTTTTQQPPTTNSPPPAASTTAAPTEKRKSKTTPRPRKEYDILLDGWYFNEMNIRHNKDVDLFRNYQINPYTKKTLQYVTPKVNERRPSLPARCADCYTEDEQKLIESYNLVKRSMDKSVFVPKCRFCEPQTELMRLGWFDDPAPPVPPRKCMFILPPWNKDPCCYYYPLTSTEQVQNENYDERFRATHKMAEFIRTETMLKKFDEIMNPEGFRGKLKTARKRPSAGLPNKK